MGFEITGHEREDTHYCLVLQWIAEFLEIDCKVAFAGDITGC